MAKRNVGRFGKEKRKAYLAALASGLRRGAAAQSIGSNRETIRRHYHAHPEFLAEIELAELDACDQVEDALFQAAISGNVVACQVWLYNRASERWMDKRNLAVSGEIKGSGDGGMIINVITAIPRPPEIVEAQVRVLPEPEKGDASRD